MPIDEGTIYVYYVTPCHIENGTSHLRSIMITEEVSELGARSSNIVNCVYNCLGSVGDANYKPEIYANYHVI